MFKHKKSFQELTALLPQDFEKNEIISGKQYFFITLVLLV